MRRVVLAVALMGVLAGARTVAQSPEPKAKNLLVSVVAIFDMGEVFKGYKRKAELEETVNAKKKALEEQRDGALQSLKQLRAELALLAEGSAEWGEKKKEIVRAGKALETDNAEWEADLRSLVGRSTLDLFSEIDEAVKEHARAKGYVLVLRSDATDLPQEIQERVWREATRAVYFHDGSLDVTRDVLAVLNDPARLAKRRKFR